MYIKSLLCCICIVIIFYLYKNNNTITNDSHANILIKNEKKKNLEL